MKNVLREIVFDNLFDRAKGVFDEDHLIESDAIHEKIYSRKNRAV